ncbi:hypothetical protein N7462_003717 [Penicillium macrosclerotiorum]|uniref:uncharacterized protein n=1 Tax=Penicillium macrosclerotiorum TaxID=303699 RepID=UPI0025495D9A|nr:uncharacterized protein N7462_003717 [Penicillium macrosclerotiorum]KAJ5689325.1 hypothetical protein N7462_003717 [Penicillium macrosclerotiorum]
MSSYGAIMPTAARGLFLSCRPSLREKSIVPALSVIQQVRGVKSNPQAKGKGKKETKVDRRGPREFRQRNLKDIEQYALCDAMRYLRAMEVGREPTASKYEVHIRIRTKKDGPVIRNMIRFPHAVQTESRICVICPPESKQAKEALAAGAVLVGEDEVFEAVKAGKIEFDRCLAHPDSLPALNKAALGRVLGPRGLMPSVKTGTVVEDVAARVEMLRGGTTYRERDALRDNLRTTIEQIKKDASGLNDRINKEIYEVVLSSSHGSGFSLNGEFKSDHSPETSALTGV